MNRLQFDEFVSKVKTDIRDYLPLNYWDMDISTFEQKSNNDTPATYLRISAGLKNEMSPVINLKGWYENYCNNGYDFRETMESISQTIMKAPIQSADAEVTKIFDYKEVKDNIFFRVVSSAKNSEIKLNSPTSRIDGNLMYTYHILIDSSKDFVQSTRVTNQLFAEYGISREELHKTAVENTRRLFPVKITSLQDALMESIVRSGRMTEEQAEEFAKMLPKDEIQPLVVTNETGICGAASFFIPGVKGRLKELSGEESYFMLPSSIHEVIIMPKVASVREDAERLQEMVTTININEVKPEEVLADGTYYYDGKTNELYRGGHVTEQDIAEEIKAAGYKPTKRLVSCLKGANELTGLMLNTKNYNKYCKSLNKNAPEKNAVMEIANSIEKELDRQNRENNPGMSQTQDGPEIMP